MAEWGYVAVGYALTGGTLIGYVASLIVRARRARARAAAARSRDAG